MSDPSILWEEAVEPGANVVARLKRGTALRLIDIEGGANAGAMIYNFECPIERYNMPDTLKAQHIARLTRASSCIRTWGAFYAPSPRTPWAGTTRSAAVPTRRWRREVR